MQDRSSGIDRSVSALTELQCLNPDLLVFENPTMEQMIIREDTAKRWPNPINADLVGLETRFVAAAKERGINIIPLMKYNPAPTDLHRIEALYNRPIDSHLSDHGFALYLNGCSGIWSAGRPRDGANPCFS